MVKKTEIFGRHTGTIIVVGILILFGICVLIIEGSGEPHFTIYKKDVEKEYKTYFFPIDLDESSIYKEVRKREKDEGLSINFCEYISKWGLMVCEENKSVMFEVDEIEYQADCLDCGCGKEPRNVGGRITTCMARCNKTISKQDLSLNWLEENCLRQYECCTPFGECDDVEVNCDCKIDEEYCELQKYKCEFGDDVYYVETWNQIK